jgi:molybdopterin molybdotransferase
VHELAVARRLRVAIVCTGDELVDVADEPERGQVRNSNRWFLDAALRECGAAVETAVTVPDDAHRLRESFEAALSSSDLLVTTGGASVGERDLVKSTLRALGVRFAFDSVAMRPARPTALGERDGTAVAVLPGNPSAVFVAFHQLVRPIVARAHGVREPRLPRVAARLSGSLHAKAERTYFPFVQLGIRDGELVATVAENQCSALHRNAARTSGLAVVPPGDARYETGDRVAVDVFDPQGLVEARA